MGRKNVSLKMIAEELGLSVNTVSHALRDFDDISATTKSRVRQKALELGYMPNQVSQRIKGGEKAVVAILVESFDNLYFNSLCKELFKVFADRKEFDCQVIYLAGDSIDVIKQCVLQRVDLLIAHVELTGEVLEFAKLQNVQIVKVSNDLANQYTDIVSIDEDMGCRLASRYLWGRQNGDKYLYVGDGCALSFIRYERFKEELEQLGVQDVLRVELSNCNSFELYDNILKGYRNIFCYNDKTAYQVLRDLDKVSGDIRRTFPDLHIIGFDGLCEEIVGLRQLTTIKIDYKAFAQAIYDMVDFRLKNPGEPTQKILLPVCLHQRIKGN